MAQTINPWDIIAEEYDISFGDEGDYSHKYVIYPALSNLIGNPADKNILDLGTGTGTYARMLANQNAHVTGVDSSVEMIKIARARNGDPEYLVHDILKPLPIRQKYDYVISSMVFHSIPNISIPSQEVLKVLKDNGHFLLVLPHPNHISHFLSLHGIDNKKYLTSQKVQFKWKQFGDICKTPTFFYIRSFQTYFQTLRKAGFHINDIIEPAIIDEAKNHLTPRYNLRSWEKLKERPSFIIFDCVKEFV